MQHVYWALNGKLNVYQREQYIFIKATLNALSTSASAMDEQ